MSSWFASKRWVLAVGLWTAAAFSVVFAQPSGGQDIYALGYPFQSAEVREAFVTGTRLGDLLRSAEPGVELGYLVGPGGSTGLTGYGIDQARARDVLREYGLGPGTHMDLVICGPRGSQAQAGLVLADRLSEIGVQASVQTMEPNAIQQFLLAPPLHGRASVVICQRDVDVPFDFNVARDYPVLLNPVPTETLQELPTQELGAGVVRGVYRTLDVAGLNGLVIRPAQNDEGTPSPIELNLFDDVSFGIWTSSVTRLERGEYLWEGNIEDADRGQAVFTLDRGGLTGHVFTGDAYYEIRPAEDGGVHQIVEVDLSNLPSELEPEVPTFEDDGGAFDLAPSNPDVATSIDLLVLYFEEVSRMGQSVRDEAIRQVAAANKTYRDSEVSLELNLVGVEPIADDLESEDFSKIRSALVARGDGAFSRVEELRDETRADIVVLLVARGSPCGKAAIMYPPNPAFEREAYAVVRNHEACRAQNSFAHEVGHLLGAAHERSPLNALARRYPDAFNFGFVDPGRAARTMMATNHFCSSCVRRWRYSDGATPLGGAYGTAQAADNALMISIGMRIAANFR